mgnify:FL=1
MSTHHQGLPVPATILQHRTRCITTQKPGKVAEHAGALLEFPKNQELSEDAWELQGSKHTTLLSKAMAIPGAVPISGPTERH